MQQQALGIHQDMPLLPFDLLARIVTAGIDAGAPFFGALDALAVNDTCRWTGLPIDQLTAFLVEFITYSVLSLTGAAHRYRRKDSAADIRAGER